MKHTFEFTDIDCLVISDALSYLIKDEERHLIDRNSASQIKDKIYETVKRDKINTLIENFAQRGEEEFKKFMSYTHLHERDCEHCPIEITNECNKVSCCLSDDVYTVLGVYLKKAREENEHNQN